MMRNLIICLLALMPISLLAGDYVDDINSSTEVRPTGQQVIYEMNVGSFTQAGTFAAAQQQLARRVFRGDRPGKDREPRAVGDQPQRRVLNTQSVQHPSGNHDSGKTGYA